ncbi:MAG: OmpA family protein [Pirellulales bacterium]|nr:OmpA family protein [Pirellulales bacterium]
MRWQGESALRMIIVVPTKCNSASFLARRIPRMRAVSTTGVWGVFLALWVGCQAPNMDAYQLAQQQTLTAQQEQGQALVRANELSAENERLNQLLAQSQQQSKLYEENVDALREQLRSSVAQVARLKDRNEAQQREFDLLQASTQRRGGAAITPNNSLAETLPAIDVEGASASRDGDVIRVTMSADRLFVPGDTRLSAQANSSIAGIARILEQNFSGRRIRIEGHLDRDPAASRSAIMEQQITANQAIAVLDAMTRVSSLSADHLSVAGMGGSTPLFSNGSPAGRERNRRIEFVIMPQDDAGLR